MITLSLPEAKNDLDILDSVSIVKGALGPHMYIYMRIIPSALFLTIVILPLTLGCMRHVMRGNTEVRPTHVV